MIRFDPKDNRHDLDMGRGPQPRAVMGNTVQGKGWHFIDSRHRASLWQWLREQGALTQVAAGPAMGLDGS
jgi:hypothetical protein